MRSSLVPVFRAWPSGINGARSVYRCVCLGQVQRSLEPGTSIAIPVADLIHYLGDRGYRQVEPFQDAERAWMEHVGETAEKPCLRTADSWFMDVSPNFAARKRTFMLYARGVPVCKKTCDDVVAGDYSGLVLR